MPGIMRRQRIFRKSRKCSGNQCGNGGMHAYEVEDFEAVGGFDEEFVVAFNDIDLCMKIRDMGKKIVFTPYAELYHYESKSRGLEDTPEKQYRFEKEITRFREKWEDQLKNGDPYYSPNLSVTEGDCSLRED